MSSKLLLILFEFLILNFELIRLGVAKKTVERMLDKVYRLYEQGADENRVEDYVRRWWIWVRCGVDGLLGCLGWLGFVSSTQPPASGRSEDGQIMFGLTYSCFILCYSGYSG